MNLEKLTRFMELTHALRQQKRNIPLKGGGNENDAEHTTQLALTAWFIIDALQLPLDMAKVFKYCLCHDLPEAYAGDVDCLASPEARKKKVECEKEARKRIQNEFPEFKDLHECMEAYERRSTGNEEAAFVYALDKLLPMNNVRISGIPQWRQQGVTFEKIISHKDQKITEVAALVEMWLELKKDLASKPHLFHFEEV